ncbi:MAG: ROK family transcriptional regulator [Alphaproteobacteria bacterium]|jgi:predicted NBD/HSP70 family sugar kinase|nr:ROK family transcriptional regulator [Alphaproteobacteria bacterium]
MKTADPELMRAINRFHVMDAIRRSGPISRVEICEQTELSPTTVSAITAALLDDGLITASPVAPAADQPRGRPRVMLSLNPQAAAVCGAKLAPNQITIAVTNFQADLLAGLSLPIRVDRQPVPVILDIVEDGVRRCVDDAGLALTDLSGLCIGLPGVIERATGICRQSPLFRERDHDFGADLQARLQLPATIDADVNLITQAEHWFGHGRGLNDFLVVSVEHVIGLGIIHGGELFRGAGGLSPDLGDLVVWPGATPGRLSATASTTAIAAAAAQRVDDAALRGSRGLERAVQLARDGGATAPVFALAGQALGVAIANLITLFAPPRVILTGSGLQAGDLLLGPLRQALRDALPVALADVAEVVVHETDDALWARGAAALSLRDLYGAPWNTTGPVKKSRNGGSDDG